MPSVAVLPSRKAVPGCNQKIASMQREQTAPLQAAPRRLNIAVRSTTDLLTDDRAVKQAMPSSSCVAVLLASRAVPTSRDDHTHVQLLTQTARHVYRKLNQAMPPSRLVKVLLA